MKKQTTKWLSLTLATLMLALALLTACNTGTTPTDTEAPTEGVTQGATMGETQSNSEVSTDASTEASTDASTDATTDASTDAVTDTVTSPETDAVTDAVTEPETEAQTQDPTDIYQLGYGSNMDMSAYDPIKVHESVKAPDDDPKMLLWFEHITEKLTRYTIKTDGQPSYTIQMGKNEYEACQFYLHYPDEKHVTVKISDFTNDAGDTLHTELGVGYYLEDGYLEYHKFPMSLVYADAIVPYDAYISKTEGGYYEEGPWVTLGPYSNKPWELDKYPYRDTSRCFVVQAKTTENSVPGAYKATIEVCDAETGKCIKMANVYTYVYDVTLSEEPAIDTSFTLWSFMEYYNACGTNATDVEILRAIADFFLEYRITITGGTTMMNMLGTDWMLNPRVSTIRVAAKDFYDSIKDNPVLAAKMFYYGQDEPGTYRAGDSNGHKSIAALKAEADMLVNEWGWKNYRMVSPFEVNRKYTGDGSKDQIDFMSRYVNIWCPKFYSFTPRELAGKILGMQFTQTVAQDKNMGTFEERMNGYVAEGDELWAYVSCLPTYTSPYQNLLLFSDGTEPRTMFWTCYDLGVTGFLYWHVSNYPGVGGNTFPMRAPFAKEGPGDGILMYPGACFGIVDPIPSIRLIQAREGIEDYQLLTMLKEVKGDAYTDEVVHHITTSTVTYTKDDDVVYNVHAYLLRALTEAQNQ